MENKLQHSIRILEERASRAEFEAKIALEHSSIQDFVSAMKNFQDIIGRLQDISGLEQVGASLLYPRLLSIRMRLAAKENLRLSEKLFEPINTCITNLLSDPLKADAAFSSGLNGIKIDDLNEAERIEAYQIMLADAQNYPEIQIKIIKDVIDFIYKTAVQRGNLEPWGLLSKFNTFALSKNLDGRLLIVNTLLGVANGRKTEDGIEISKGIENYYDRTDLYVTCTGFSHSKDPAGVWTIEERIVDAAVSWAESTSDLQTRFQIYQWCKGNIQAREECAKKIMPKVICLAEEIPSFDMKCSVYLLGTILVAKCDKQETKLSLLAQVFRSLGTCLKQEEVSAGALSIEHLRTVADIFSVSRDQEPLKRLQDSLKNLKRSYPSLSTEISSLEYTFGIRSTEGSHALREGIPQRHLI